MSAITADAGNWHIGSSTGLIARSTNEGMTWSTLYRTTNAAEVYSIVVKDGALFVATAKDGVLRSVDNGATWAAVDNGLPGMDIRCLLVRGPAILASTWAGGVYRGTDNGENLQSCNVERRFLTMVADGGTVYAGRNGQGMVTSSDDGAT